MATHPIGPNTKTIPINMSNKMADELEARAESMDLSTSRYCKSVLAAWLDSGEEFTTEQIDAYKAACGKGNGGRRRAPLTKENKKLIKRIERLLLRD